MSREDQIRSALQQCEDDEVSFEDLNLNYFVIFTIDVPSDTSISSVCGSLAWKQWLKKLEITEKDSEYDYSYLEGEWEKGKHRKLVGELNQDDFSSFCDDFGLIPENVETMGSLTGFGWLPAISFRSDSEEAIINAYVTPIWPFQDQEYPEEASQINLLGDEAQEARLQNLEEKLWKATKSIVVDWYK